MFGFIFSFCVLVSPVGWFDGAGLERAAAQEDTLDRLRVGAERYVGGFVVDWEKRRACLQSKIDQKVADSGLSEDAALSQYLLDFLAEKESGLKAGPKEAKKELIVTVAVHIRYFTEKSVTIKGWKKYEKELDLWANWFLEQKKEKADGPK